MCPEYPEELLICAIHSGKNPYNGESLTTDQILVLGAYVTQLQEEKTVAEESTVTPASASVFSKHSSLLNELDDMQRTPLYAIRRKTLEQAELLIFNQEQEINTLKEELFALRAKQQS